MRWLWSGTGILCALAGTALAIGSMGADAKDYGQVGQTFPVIEPDLLATIENRLRRAEASGEMARVNEQFARRVEAKVRRPDPVTGLSPADRPREWNFDPSVILERDIRDHKGRLIAAAGQKINPLDFLKIVQELVFIDGENSAQMQWATSRYSESQAKIILVAGSPIEEMTRRQRRFYFDQQGRLTAKFGIRHTPAVVKQAGKVMRVREILLDKGRAS